MKLLKLLAALTGAITLSLGLTACEQPNPSAAQCHVLRGDTWTGTYCMNLRSPNWRQRAAHYCAGKGWQHGSWTPANGRLSITPSCIDRTISNRAAVVGFDTDHPSY